MATSTLSDDDMRDIAGHASTIDERLAGLAVVEAPANDTERERARELLFEWCQVAAAGDDRLFADRLRHDGLDEKPRFSSSVARVWPRIWRCRIGPAFSMVSWRGRARPVRHRRGPCIRMKTRSPRRSRNCCGRSSLQRAGCWQNVPDNFCRGFLPIPP